jgi:hypothetical protein
MKLILALLLTSTTATAGDFHLSGLTFPTEVLKAELAERGQTLRMVGRIEHTGTDLGGILIFADADGAYSIVNDYEDGSLYVSKVGTGLTSVHDD